MFDRSLNSHLLHHVADEYRTQKTAAHRAHQMCLVRANTSTTSNLILNAHALSTRLPDGQTVDQRHHQLAVFISPFNVIVAD